MRFLLDTHILLWLLSDSPYLKKEIKEQIVSAQENLVSVASMWEIIIKKKADKLDSPDNLKEAIEYSNLSILPINFNHVLETEKLPDIHKDPFDRIIACQAICENLTLITKDEIIAEYGVKILRA